MRCCGITRCVDMLTYGVVLFGVVICATLRCRVLMWCVVLIRLRCGGCVDVWHSVAYVIECRDVSYVGVLCCVVLWDGGWWWDACSVLLWYAVFRVLRRCGRL